MTNCDKGDTIRFAAYNPERDTQYLARDIEWKQMMSAKKARFYEVEVKNVTQDKETMIYIQDRFYKDESSADFVGKLSGIKKEGGLCISSFLGAAWRLYVNVLLR
jgi:hypothetical protein